MKNQIALLATTYDDDEMTKCRSATQSLVSGCSPNKQAINYQQPKLESQHPRI
jgi:hypothetical protein